MTDSGGDAAARALARWLAPYIARELGLPLGALEHLNSTYDRQTCERYVEGLGTRVIHNAIVLFGLLAERGSVGSAALAEAIGVGSPRQLAGVVTTSLKRRSAALGLELPWTQLEDTHSRTVWRDRDGIAARMLEALRSEEAGRAR